MFDDPSHLSFTCSFFLSKFLFDLWRRLTSKNPTFLILSTRYAWSALQHDFVPCIVQGQLGFLSCQPFSNTIFPLPLKLFLFSVFPKALTRPSIFGHSSVHVTCLYLQKFSKTFSTAVALMSYVVQHDPENEGLSACLLGRP